MSYCDITRPYFMVFDARALVIGLAERYT